MPNGQPTRRTHRTHCVKPWPVNAVHLYGVRCEVIVTIDKTADVITVHYPRKGVRLEKGRAGLALKNAKGRRVDLHVTLEKKDGTSFVLSPAEGDPEGTIWITIPSLARSDHEYATTRKTVIAIHNDSNGDRADNIQPDDGVNLGDPKAYKILHKPTFEQ